MLMRPSSFALQSVSNQTSHNGSISKSSDLSHITLPAANSPADIHILLTQITRCNLQIKQYLPFLQQHLISKVQSHRLNKTIALAQTPVSKRVYALQLLDESLMTELQAYPYTRPENVRDDFDPIETTHILDANSISTAHLYPPSQSQSQSGLNHSPLHTNKPQLTDATFCTPTVPLNIILYMSRQLQGYIAASPAPKEFKKFGKSYAPTFLLAGLLVKPLDELLQEMAAFTI